MAIRDILYRPEIVPENSEAMQEFLSRELARISAAIGLIAAGQLIETFVAPAKPRTGMIKLADGTKWNPGALGRGVFYYDEFDSLWHKL